MSTAHARTFILFSRDMPLPPRLISYEDSLIPFLGDVPFFFL